METLRNFNTSTLSTISEEDTLEKTMASTSSVANATTTTTTTTTAAAASGMLADENARFSPLYLDIASPPPAPIATSSPLFGANYTSPSNTGFAVGNTSVGVRVPLKRKISVQDEETKSLDEGQEAIHFALNDRKKFTMNFFKGEVYIHFKDVKKNRHCTLTINELVKLFDTKDTIMRSYSMLMQYQEKKKKLWEEWARHQPTKEEIQQLIDTDKEMNQML